MNQVDKDIKAGSFARVYLIWGEENYLKKLYRKRLYEALVLPGSEMNVNTWKGDAFDQGQFQDLALTLPFFAAHRLLMVEDSGLFKKGGQAMAEFLPSLPDTSVAVFVESETDARSVLYKYVQKNGVILKLDHQKETALTDWILRFLGRNGKQIQKSAMKLFLERTGDDMETILHEAEKLVSYTGDSQNVMLKDVQAVVTDHTQNRIFELSDRLAGHDRAGALELYNELLSQRQSALGLLAMLGNHFERLARVKDLRTQGYDQHIIAQKMGMKPFVVRKSISQAESFSEAALHGALELMVKAEEDVKLGRMRDVQAVEMVILEISA